MSDKKENKKSRVSMGIRLDEDLYQAAGAYLEAANRGKYKKTEKVTLDATIARGLRAVVEGRIQESTNGTSPNLSTKDFSGEPKNSLALEHVSGNTMDAIRAALDEILIVSKEIRKAVFAEVSRNASGSPGSKPPEGRNSAQATSRVSAAEHEATAAELKQRLQDAQQNSAGTRKPADKRRKSA